MDRASAESMDEILEFWFGTLSGPHDVDRTKNRLWWGGGEAIDAEVRRRFGTLVRAACAGELDGWKGEARGALALVILLDQLTRNVFRGTAEAYAGDPRAVDVCTACIDDGRDRQLRWIERSFLYMPLMHAEDRATAERSLEVFEALSREIGAQPDIDHPDFLSSAKRHADIVLRFGRYPHRNELLGRPSTPEEEAFLASGGPTFGQAKKDS